MTLPPRVIGYAVAGAVVLAVLGYIGHLRSAVRRERLERLNTQADADVTAHFLRGQLQVATRLVAQRPLAGGATATVTIRVPGATVTRVDTVFVGDTVRAQLDTNGVHVSAVVALQPLPPTWTWNLRQDPLTYRVTFEGCHDHAARVNVEGPRWQAVQLVELQQNPNICNPAPGWQPFSLKAPSALWVVVIAGVTVLLVK